MPYTINGQPQTFAEPIHGGGVLYVPLTPIIESLGGVIIKADATDTFNVDLHGVLASVSDKEANVDRVGHQIALSAPAFLQDGEMFVPVDFFRDVLNCEVHALSDDITIREHQARAAA